jgi:hypothetical protein
MNRSKLPGLLAGAGFFGSLLLAACSADTTTLADPTSYPGPEPDPDSGTQCSIPQDQILSGGPGKDGIPALSNPLLVGKEHPGAAYLASDDRVVGLTFGSGPIAIPLNIFWWHEIVNLEIGDQALAITHCPLTGSSMGFNRAAALGAEFGVSGLLYKNNLIMYDRNGDESLWPQMLRGARCGTRDGQELPMVPIIEMSWEAWKTLHPQTLVVSDDTQYSRDYNRYPYGSYDQLDNSTTLFPANIDDRRPAKERVLGIPFGSGGVAFPFGLLDEEGAVAAVSGAFPGGAGVVFWDRESQAAMAFSPTMDAGNLTFSVVDGRITDDQTGSVWRVDGLAEEGPLTGRQLQPVAEAFVAFWFAWPEFYPEIKIWKGRI